MQKKHKKKILYLLLIFFLSLTIILLFNVFDRIPDNSSSEDYMLFEIDFNLLGERYDDTELYIKFHPPSGWLPLPDEMLQEVSSADEDEDNYMNIEIQIRQIFYESNTRSICFLSVLTGSDGLINEDIISLYIQEMENKFADLNTQTGSFKHNNFRTPDLRN